MSLRRSLCVTVVGASCCCKFTFAVDLKARNRVDPTVFVQRSTFLSRRRAAQSTGHAPTIGATLGRPILVLPIAEQPPPWQSRLAVSVSCRPHPPCVPSPARSCPCRYRARRPRPRRLRSCTLPSRHIGGDPFCVRTLGPECSPCLRIEDTHHPLPCPADRRQLASSPPSSRLSHHFSKLWWQVRRRDPLRDHPLREL